MEPFDFAVGLGPVGAGAFVGHVGVGEGLGPQPRPVTGEVVGQAALDGDALVGEPAVGTPPEPGCGGSLFVVEDLR